MTKEKDLITAQADVVTDEAALTLLRKKVNCLRLEVDSSIADDIMKSVDEVAAILRSKELCVTDEDIQAEALSYASKPLAPYLRSEVFADGARWGISRLAQPKTEQPPTYWDESYRKSMYFLEHKCGLSESLAMAVIEHFRPSRQITQPSE